jgi:Transposase domain (DUF772)
MRATNWPDHGRHALTAVQVLRALVLMRLKNWDYRELRERIADGITLRQFTDFYCEDVPRHDAVNRSLAGADGESDQTAQGAALLRSHVVSQRD